jgi:glycosyltransferase involved in cell wall biosynthesis
MKLLIINHYRKSKVWRWGRNYAIASELARRGHEIHLFIISDHRKIIGKEYVEDGIHIYEFPDLNWGRMRSGWDIWCGFQRSRVLASRQLSFDLIHTFETRPATIYPVLHHMKEHKFKLVMDWNDWWARGGLITEHRPWWYRHTMGFVEQYYEEHFRYLADYHTVTSEALAERLVGMGISRSQIHLMANGAMPDYFHPIPKEQARAALSLPLDAPIAIFTGFDVLVDLDLVLHTFQIVSRFLPQSILLLTGRIMRSTEKFIFRNNLEANIRQLGYISEKKLIQAIASSDFCYMPFTNRICNLGRFPGKVAEYLSMGKPVITNPVGEMKRIFTGEKFGLLSQETPLAMAEKSLLLFSNPVLRESMSTCAREYARTTLSWSSITDGIEEVYTRLVEGALPEK